MAPIAIESHMVSYDDVRADLRVVAARHAPLLEAYHRLWYETPSTWGMTLYQGIPTMKAPSDLWIVSELLHRHRPTVIIETGTAFGGSALYYAHAFDAMQNGPGRILTIDLDTATELPSHPRVRYLRGRSSTDPDLVAQVGRMIGPGDRVMVMLDSDHRTAHVLAELDAYAPLVTPGQYLIVEDTNVNGHPVPWPNGPGPAEAVAAWLPTHPGYEADPLCERYLLTMHPGGWIRRIE